MSPSTGSLPFLTDFRQAEIAFCLLFAYMRDEACTDPDFDGALSDLLCGARIPEPARARLKVVYDRILKEDDSFARHAAAAAEAFSTERFVLYALLSIMLRLTTDDGLLCRRDSERIRWVLQLFSLTAQECEHFSPAERSLIDYFSRPTKSAPYESSHANYPELSNWYAILGCTPESSDAQIRAAYRRLVMKTHPDRTTTASSPKENRTDTRRAFETVQQAYEHISIARKRDNQRA